MKQQRISEIASWSMWESAATDPSQTDPADPNAPENYGPFSERQSAMFWFQVGLTQGLGKYSQDSGPDGAHYFDSAANPFVDEGLVCGNCAFYMSATTCEIVDGNIDPQGLCKNWLIPDSAMGNQGPDMTPQDQQAAMAKKKKKPKKPAKNFY